MVDDLTPFVNDAVEAMLEVWMPKAFRDAVSFIKGMDAIEPGESVAALCRVTTPAQKTNGSLDRQAVTLREEIRLHGGKVPITYKARFKGYTEKWFAELDRVFAKVAMQGITKLVIRYLSRVVRSPEYGNYNHEARPSPQQLRRVQHLAEKHGLTIVSVLSPLADFYEERSRQTKQGGRCGRAPGTKIRYDGWSKDRTAAIRQIALDAVDEGYPYRQAAAVANANMQASGNFIRPISHEAVRKWDLKRQAMGDDGGRRQAGVLTFAPCQRDRRKTAKSTGFMR